MTTFVAICDAFFAISQLLCVGQAVVSEDVVRGFCEYAEGEPLMGRGGGKVRLAMARKAKFAQSPVIVVQRVGVDGKAHIDCDHRALHNVDGNDAKCEAKHRTRHPDRPEPLLNTTQVSPRGGDKASDRADEKSTECHRAGDDVADAHDDRQR